MGYFSLLAFWMGGAGAAAVVISEAHRIFAVPEVDPTPFGARESPKGPFAAVE